jgi:hypothetical protein
MIPRCIKEFPIPSAQFHPAFRKIMLYIYLRVSKPNKQLMAFKIANDKKKHFFVGIPLGLLLQFLSSYFFPVQPVLATTISVGILAAICYGFELFSLITGIGYAENLDAIAGILGGIIGIAIYWCIRLLI